MIFSLSALTSLFTGANALSIGKSLLQNWKLVFIAVLVCMVYLRGCTIDDLERQIEGFEDAIATVNETLIQNVAAINDCQRINQENEAEAHAMRERAKAAEDRVIELSAHSDRDVEEIEHAATKVRESGANLHCAALNDPVVLDWVYDSE